MSESNIDTSESVAARAWRDAKRSLHHWIFISAELVGSAAVGYVTQSAIATLVMVLGLLVAVLLFALVRAPLVQRREARALAQRLLQEQSQAKLARLLIVGVVCESAIETVPGVLNAPRIPATYIKVGFRAVGQEAARCTAYLTKLQRRIGGQLAECELLDPIRLKWASENGAEVLDLHPAMPRYVDLLSCNANRNLLDLCTGVSRPVKAQGFFKSPGTYMLRILLLSEGGLSSPEADVIVEWPGDHSATTAAMAPVDGHTATR